MPALKIHRYDDDCALCRVAEADKAGSHLAPNFLGHGAFSFDGKGGRFREIVARDNLNTQSRWLFYGQEVSPEAISADRGRSLTDEELGRPELVIRNLDVFFFGDVKRHWFARKGEEYDILEDENIMIFPFDIEMFVDMLEAQGYTDNDIRDNLRSKENE